MQIEPGFKSSRSGETMAEATLTIGDKGRLTAGINTSAVRYYERVGVLPEPERASGQRRYTPDTVDRLQSDPSRPAGRFFSLDEIRQLSRAGVPRRSRLADELRALAERKLPGHRGI